MNFLREFLPGPSNSRRLHVLALALAAVFWPVPSAVAVTQFTAGSITWDNGITRSWGQSGGPYNTSVWTAGNVAGIEGNGGTITIAPAGATALAVVANSGNYTVAGGPLTLLGPETTIVTALMTNLSISSPITSTAGLKLEGNGTLALAGLATLSGGDIEVGASTSAVKVNLVSPGRLTLTTAHGLRIGNGDSAFNVLHVSSPGTSAAPSVVIDSLTVGGVGFDNELRLSGGAFLARGATATQGAWSLGVNAGANHNRLIVTGAGSTAGMNTSGLRQFLNVGVGGSQNYVRVENGGALGVLRFGVGTGGGSGNYLLVTGVGSTLSAVDAQMILAIGNTPGASGNSLRIEAGATATATNDSDARRAFHIGGGANANGSNTNFLRVTGAGSVFQVNHVRPLCVGGLVENDLVTDSNTVGNTATGNFLEVTAGGRLNLAATTSLYVLGVGSLLRIGDGTAASTLNVGANPTFVSGVFLKNADARLRFNVGVLGALANGSLVSGAGEIVFDGPATITTTQAGSIVSTAIGGMGGLTKAGVGTLTLSGPGSFTGPTILEAGTLIASGVNGTAALGGTSSVTLNAGTTLQLGAPAQLSPNAGIALAGGKLATGGLSQSLGVVTLSANSVLDFGSGASVVRCAPSASGWTAGRTLSVWNWSGSGTDELYFGDTAAGLTAAQASQITFYANSGTTSLGTGLVLPTGEVVPVNAPRIAAATPTVFATIYGSASPVQTLAITGTNVTGGITATAPMGYEVSSNGTSYGATTTFPATGGSLRVRLSAAATPATVLRSVLRLTATGTGRNLSVAGTVAPRALSVSGAVAQNKNYDGTVVATIVGASLTGVVPPDAISLGGGCTFATAQVGSGIPVTAALVLNGVNAPFYTLTQPTGLTANIFGPPRVGAVVTTPGSSVIQAFGFPGQTYTLEFVDDLRGTWAPLLVATADANGAFGFTDLLRSSPTQRFYRIR